SCANVSLQYTACKIIPHASRIRRLATTSRPGPDVHPPHYQEVRPHHRPRDRTLDQQAPRRGMDSPDRHEPVPTSVTFGNIGSTLSNVILFAVSAYFVSDCSNKLSCDTLNAGRGIVARPQKYWPMVQASQDEAVLAARLYNDPAEARSFEGF